MSILKSLPNIPRKFKHLGEPSALPPNSRQLLNLPQRVLRNDSADSESLDRELDGKDRGRSMAIQTVLTCLPLMLVDLVTLVFCVASGLVLSSLIGFTLIPDMSHTFVVLSLGTLITFQILGLYDCGGMHPIYEFRQVIIGSTVVFLLFSSVTANASFFAVSASVFPIMLIAVPAARKIARAQLAKTSWWGVRAIVINCNDRVNDLYKQHQKNARQGLIPVGYVQNVLPDQLDDGIQEHYLGTTDSVGEAVKNHQAHYALLHRCSRSDEELFEFTQTFLQDFSKVILIPDDHWIPSLWSLGHRGGVCFEDRLLAPSSAILKRSIDIAITIGALVVLSPALIGIAILCKLSDPGPLFYGHKRIGKHGRRFKAWKFRTMRVNADDILQQTLANNPELTKEWEATYKLKNDPRITKVGNFLRKSSLDELPQLWNVLLGQMSLVGPRPIVVGEVERYDDRFANYLRVLPGVTGFWQVSGRNLTTYDQRVELDDFYVQNWSVWFDFYILFRTIKTVLFREGAF